MSAMILNMQKFIFFIFFAFQISAHTETKEWILIHTGNTDSHTAGCLLLGE